MHDHSMRLKYYNPYLYNTIVDAGEVRFDEEWYDERLDAMVKMDPRFIFFITVETTDVPFVEELETAVTHSCSCHIKNQGPCPVCKAIGCEVWDFNEVAMPILDPEAPRLFEKLYQTNLRRRHDLP